MRTMSLLRILLLGAVVSMVMVSCTTPIRFTYAAENIRGNAIMDEAKMLADYGKFAIQYTSEGGVTIINNTDSIMYIDMAKSYYMSNGVARQLYSNSVTTNFSSGTQGATVNMGSVASAMGVGGALGTLARGVNVGASNTSGTSTQVFEEQYITIPPLSRKQVKSFLSEPVDKVERLGAVKDNILFDGSQPWPWQEIRYKNGRIKEGTYEFDRDMSPSQEYIFAYSFNPNEKFQSTRDLFYVTKIEMDKKLRDTREGKNQITKEVSSAEDNKRFILFLIGDIAVLIACLIMAASTM